MSILSSAVEKIEGIVDSIAPARFLSGTSKQAAIVADLLADEGVTRRDLLGNKTFQQTAALHPRRTREEWAELLKGALPDAGLGLMTGSWKDINDTTYKYDTRLLVEAPTEAQLKHRIRVNRT